MGYEGLNELGIKDKLVATAILPDNPTEQSACQAEDPNNQPTGQTTLLVTFAVKRG